MVLLMNFLLLLAFLVMMWISINYQIRALKRILRQIVRLIVCGGKGQAVRLKMSLTYPDGTKLEDVTMANIEVTQQVVASVAPVDRKGSAAEVETGTVEWASSDESILKVTEDPANEFSALLVAAGVPGTAKARFSADADLGAGVVAIFGEVEITVTKAQAVGFSITLGTPTEQPEVVPPVEPPPVG